MSSGLYPAALKRSVYDIDFGVLFDAGIRGLIFDIDNTLVPHGAPADERSEELFGKLRAIGFETYLVSNNRELRVKPFADSVGSGYAFKAGKPSAKGYREAMNFMRTSPETTVSIGDQIFTDTLGASNAGIRSILVHRIAFSEEIQIHFKRVIEVLIMGSYHIVHAGKDMSPERVFGGEKHD